VGTYDRKLANFLCHMSDISQPIVGLKYWMTKYRPFFLKYAKEKLANILRMLHCDWSKTVYAIKTEWMEKDVGELLCKFTN